MNSILSFFSGVLSANHGIFAENDPPMVKNWAGATEGKTTKLVIPDELRDQVRTMTLSKPEVYLC